MASNLPVGFSIMTATLECLGAPKRYSITMGCGGSGGISAATINTAWVAALAGSGSSPFDAGNMDTNWSFVEAKTTKALAGGAFEVADVTLTVIGTATLATPAPNTSVLVAKKTIYGGRRYRGRMSVPPCNIAEGDISRAGIIATTPLGVQSGYWNYVYSFLVSAGVQPYLIHYPTTLPDGGDFPPAPTSIAFLEVSPLVGTNGSRLR